MSVFEIWVGYSAIVTREILRFTRIWMQTLLPPVITTTLYFVIFGNLIGSRIGEMDGHQYMDFIVPGLIMMAVISNAYSNTVSSFYSSKFQGNLEEMLVSPLPNWVIVAGFVSGGVVRGLLVGFAVTLVSLFFSDLQVYSIGIMVSIVFLTSILFSLAGFINGVFANSFDDVSIIPTFVLTPLTYLGGVFYSIKLLPDFWQGVSFLNPVLYMVNGFRHGILGSSDMSPGASYLLIIVFTTGLCAFALWLLSRGIGIRK